MKYLNHLTRIVIVLLCSFICLDLSAQTFQKTYGGTNEEYIYTTEQLSDGGYIMCGRTFSGTINASWDAYVLRLNSAGDTLWTRNYGNIGYDEFQSVYPTSDGGFILCGQTDVVNLSDADVYLVKITSTGALSWSTAYGSASTADFGYSVRQTTDGGYIIGGLSASAGAGGRDMLLIKTNSTGVVTWSKTYGGSADDEGRSVEPTADGGYILAGFTSSYGSNIQAYVVKTTSTGVVSWSKTFGGSNNELAYSVKQASDQSYYVAGYTNSYGAGNNDAMLIKLTSAGVMSWSKTYGGSGEDYALSMKITSDNGCILAGRTASYGGGNADYYLIKTDAAGTHSWSKAYGGTALDQGNNVIQTTDGGYVITGFANSYGQGQKDAFIIKTDATGTSGCNEVTASTQTGSSTITNGTGATESAGISAASPTTATRATTTVKGTQCFTAGNSCPVDASFTSSVSSVCVGASVSFTNTTTGGAIGYAWKDNNTLFSTAQSPTYTFSTAGSHIVTLIATNGTCVDSISSTITVNALPTATITPSGATTFCQGGSVTLTASAGASWLWSPGGATTQSINVTTNGTYTVTVTNANNCSATSSATTVTVNQPPTATISPGGPTTFCQGGSVTLTASAGTSWLWSPGGQTTQSINVTNGGTYTVTVTNGNNCSATSIGTTVTVNQPPTATITPSGATTFCQGGSVTLTASAGTSWLWSPGGQTTQSINVTSNGTYTVTVTNGNNCSATSLGTTVTVNPLPTATITPSGSTTFCTGGSVTLNASAGTSWLWSPGGATTQSINVTSGGTYTVTVTNANNCSATSSPVTVTVQSSPTATITTGGPTTFCQGGSVTLTASSGNSYLWSPGGQTTQVINVTQNGTYTVTVSNGPNCSATSTATTVTVNPLPTPLITHITTVACDGDSVLLTASAGTSWLWTPTGETTQSIYAHTYGRYSVTITNQYNCSASTDTTLVTIVTPPNVTITGPTTFCEGNFVTLTASPSGVYSWSPGGETTQSITVSAGGTYIATITAWPNCTSSDTVQVTVYPTPAAPTVTLNNGVLHSSVATGVEWYMQGNPNVLGTGQTYTPTQDGDYYVVYTDANGCTVMSNAVFVDVTGIEENISSKGVIIYPNPAENVLSVSATKYAGYSYTLFDSLGRSILSGKLAAENTNIAIDGLASGMYILTLNGNTKQSFKVMKQ